MADNRNKAFTKLATLREAGISDTAILESILKDFLSGDQALEAMEHCTDDFEITMSDLKEDEND